MRERSAPSPIKRGTVTISAGSSQLQIRLPTGLRGRIKALACGGPDAVWNMQWQTNAEGKACRTGSSPLPPLGRNHQPGRSLIDPV
jgi:hypothetical protein